MSNQSTKTINLRLRLYRFRERISYAIRKRIANVAAAIIRAMRRVLKMTGTRCTWCGADPGFQSSISRKGLRCNGYGRDCEDFP